MKKSIQLYLESNDLEAIVAQNHLGTLMHLVQNA